MARPKLVVVSGPPGSGKTSLAHELARTIGCPAVCRDEIKEGMVHAYGSFDARIGDELTHATFGLFFEVVDLLLGRGVTVVAEAAFQDRLWRPGLEALAALADIRLIHCTVDGPTAYARRLGRVLRDPIHGIHRDLASLRADEEGAVTRHAEFLFPSFPDAPALRVSTEDGYAPSLTEIAAFVNG